MPLPTKAVTNSIHFSHLYFGRRGREKQYQFNIKPKVLQNPAGSDDPSDRKMVEGKGGANSHAWWQR